jgi:hypothetical protein
MESVLAPSYDCYKYVLRLPFIRTRSAFGLFHKRCKPAPSPGEGQPGFKGALLLVEPGKDAMVGIGLEE